MTSKSLRFRTADEALSVGMGEGYCQPVDLWGAFVVFRWADAVLALSYSCRVLRTGIWVICETKALGTASLGVIY